jgi:hypothetical protein
LSEPEVVLTHEQKYINFIPSVAFDATLQASWEAVAVSFQAGLLNGGPVWVSIPLVALLIVI